MATKKPNPHSIAALIEANYPEYYSWHTYPVDKCAKIYKADGEWGILSNFGNTPLTVNGVTFCNVEQLFQLMKFHNLDPISDIYGSRGLTIKMKAKKWETNYRIEDWGSMLIDALKFCLMTKYEQCEAFREELERSKGLYIVEDQSNNNKKKPDTWGVKLNADGMYEGSNLLGRLLMELRDNGRLTYSLPTDAFEFTNIIKNVHIDAQ